MMQAQGGQVWFTVGRALGAGRGGIGRGKGG